MNSTFKVFQFIKETLLGNEAISNKVSQHVFPISVLREVPLPYIIYNPSYTGKDDSKDGIFERSVTIDFYAFSDNMDEAIELTSEIEKVFLNIEGTEYFPVSDSETESWSFSEEDKVYGGIITINLKTD